jgi:hypothetical protein
MTIDLTIPVDQIGYILCSITVARFSVLAIDLSPQCYAPTKSTLANILCGE